MAFHTRATLGCLNHKRYGLLRIFRRRDFYVEKYRARGLTIKPLTEVPRGVSNGDNFCCLCGFVRVRVYFSDLPEFADSSEMYTADVCSAFDLRRMVRSTRLGSWLQSLKRPDCQRTKAAESYNRDGAETSIHNLPNLPNLPSGGH